MRKRARETHTHTYTHRERERERGRERERERERRGGGEVVESNESPNLPAAMAVICCPMERRRMSVPVAVLNPRHKNGMLDG